MFALAAVCTFAIPFIQRRKEWVPPRTMSRRESQAVIKARESVSDNMCNSESGGSELEFKKTDLTKIEEDDVFIEIKSKSEIDKSEVVDQYVWVV